MSEGLRDLLERMREHPAFPEMLKGVGLPEVKNFRPSADHAAADQAAQWMFRSGQEVQQQRWLEFLTKHVPTQQEKL